MEDAARLRVQYLLAMTENEVMHQQLNLHKFIRGRFRWRRGFRRRRIWRRIWLNPIRRRSFRLYDQLLVELRREDPSAIKKFLCIPPELYDEILERIRIRRQYTWYREPLEEGLKLAATLRHLVSGTKYSDMQYGWMVPENTLSVMAREVCQAICDEYADEVMTAPSTPDGWRKLADGFYERWNFPYCVAAIDGKHVAVRKPPLSGYGSSGDAQNYNSEFKEMLEDGSINFPDPDPLPPCQCEHTIFPGGRRCLQPYSEHDEALWSEGSIQGAEDPELQNIQGTGAILK